MQQPFTGGSIRAALWLFLLSQSASAFDYTINVGYQADYTTNTARTEADEIDEIIHRPSIDTQIVHDGPSIFLEGDYQYERRIYSEDFFEDNDVVTGAGELVWHVIDQKLDLRVANTRTESTIQAFQANTPGNRQVSSETRAGPILTLPVRGADEFQLEYEFTSFDSETTDTSGDRQAAIARYILALSANRSITLELNRSEDDFDTEFAPDIESDTASLTYASLGERLELSVTAGYEKTQRSLGRDDLGGAVGNLSAIFRFNDAQRLEFTYVNDFNDRTLVLGAGRARFGDDNNADSDLSELFEENNSTLRYVHDFGRTSMNGEINYRQLDFDDGVPRDQLSTGLSIGLDHQLSPNTNFNAQISVTKRDFQDIDRVDDELRGNARLVWQATRNIQVSTGVRFTERDSEIDTFNFEEWVATVGFFYNFVGTN